MHTPDGRSADGERAAIDASTAPSHVIGSPTAPDAVSPPNSGVANATSDAGDPIDSRAARHAAAGNAAGADPQDLEARWLLLQAAIRERVQTEQFETWFRRAALTRVDQTLVQIAVQNGFTRDWLNAYYREVLEQAVESVFGMARRVEFTVDPELMVTRRSLPPQPAPPTAGAAANAPQPPSATPTGVPGAPLSPAPRPVANGRGPLALTPRPAYSLLEASDTQLNPQYQFGAFVVGPCNRFAHAASVGVSEAPGQAYNPFFMHGSVGLGKTHLLQSLCHSLLERDPTTQILYLSCETFVNHFISALENGDLQKFRTKYRNVDVLVVDDIHILANKERTQEEFFHTFNTLYNAGKQIVLSSDSPPKDIPTLQGRLVSRFKWGLVTELEPPCFETRVAILKRKSRNRGQELGDDVAALLAEHIDTNIRELEGAVTKLLGFAKLSARPVTVDLVRECLRDTFREQRSQPSIEDIQRLVTEHFGVKLADLLSRKRTNAIAFPRQVGMYLARKVTRLSLEEIGGFYGGRDHSTVLYAIQKLQRLQGEDPAICELLAGLLSRLGYRGV